MLHMRSAWRLLCSNRSLFVRPFAVSAARCKAIRTHITPRTQSPLSSMLTRQQRVLLPHRRLLPANCCT